MKLRDLDGYKAAQGYIYSDSLNKMPDISSANKLFFEPKG
jgi:hypothetical protein